MTNEVTDQAPVLEAKPRRRSPISRETGEQRLIDATLALLRERPFQEVGVRDIAARADVNHGFVHTWFGGKNQLLERALRVVLLTVSEKVKSAEPGSLAAQPFDPDVQLAVRIMMWLTIETGQSPVVAEQHVVTSLAHRYVAVEGMEPATARIAAQHAVAIVVSTVLYGPLVGMASNEDTVSSLAQWRHVVRLLAEHPAQ